jgi:hypothetical protein
MFGHFASRYVVSQLGCVCVRIYTTHTLTQNLCIRLKLVQMKLARWRVGKLFDADLRRLRTDG